jgi:PAS domain S-box-containing protein
LIQTKQSQALILAEGGTMVKIRTGQIYEDIIETIRDPLLILDQDLRVVLASPSFYEFFKVKSEETVGQLIYDLGNKQWDIPKLRELLETILPEKTTFNSYEVEHDFSSIGRRTMLLNARQIKRAMGKERIILLAIEDITQRKKLEDMLAESLECYREVFDTSKDGILLFEKDGLTIRHANPAIEAMLEYSKEELVGNSLGNIVFPDDIGSYQEMKQTLNEVGILHYRAARIKKKTGQIFDTDIYMIDKTDLVQCILGNISKRKQVEESLQSSNEKFRSIMDNICVGVALISPTMEILELNQQMREWFPDIDPRMRPICYRAYNNPPRDEICDYCPTHWTLKDGLVHEATTVTPAADGSRNYRIVSSPIFDKNGEVIAAIEMVDDKTERVLLEKQLRHSQQLESIGTLAGGIAHDFNNILTSVIGYTELALDEVDKETALEEYLQEIYTAGKRARELVKQILTFARQADEEVRPIQVDIIVKEMLKFIRSSLPSSIEIKQNIESDALIMGNAIQVHQIMMNLCTNAAHAMKEGLGVLEVRLKEGRTNPGPPPALDDFHMGDYLKLSVSDNGTGISPSVIGQIFDPYFTTKGVGEGTGMGLSMVHGIVENHGGKITVDSELGKGTTFTIYLPITKRQTAFRPYEQSALPLGTERILFVDDELPIAKLGGRILEGLGYQVTVRTGSVEALELFKQKPNDFDLIITDMAMPNMPGDMLAAQLIKIRSDIPVILCTGYSTKISEHSIAAIGIKAIENKPIVKANFAKTVRKVLDEAKA